MATSFMAFPLNDNNYKMFYLAGFDFDALSPFILVLKNFFSCCVVF